MRIDLCVAHTVRAVSGFPFSNLVPGRQVPGRAGRYNAVDFEPEVPFWLTMKSTMS